MSGIANGWDDGIFYIGSYGEKQEATIHTCRMNKTTGELHIIQRFSGAENASFLALHPKGTHLYAAKEIGESGGEPGGEIAALSIDGETGLLKEITNVVTTIGQHPCYVSVNEAGTAVYAANYTGGNITLLPLTDDGELKQAASLMQHESEPGPVADRQGSPHAHCVVPIPGTPFISAVDLGMDAVVTYRHDTEAGILVNHHITKLQGGTGPRHIAFHGTIPVAYVTNELASSVTLLHLDRDAGLLTEGATYSTIPSKYTGYNDSADIHISADGRFLYSSNRGHNSIAVFAIDEQTGELTSIQHIECGGEQPRNFGLTPDGNYLLVANQKTGNVVVFNRDIELGTITQTSFKLELNAPVTICFASNSN
ncbi:lactonase family protein [Paenibacillus sp. GSMTC-2017]|uniref:lactonase family protein n=1 Tax=Paenibacillus sp. GSMTC-2017 TaxID=2794350 RepID=UPI0018D6B76B|nr:lactonase family protein [Paenibacillus sp. GSMTC-2017]MBH5317398.1 lactonase family protein [Paenibacillus sp. GSMTC-2017]